MYIAALFQRKAVIITWTQRSADTMPLRPHNSIHKPDNKGF
jgi:hypothetical protein